MTEYTITFTAEFTVVVTASEDGLDRLMSEEFPKDLEESLLNVWPEHQDVHVRDLKVFISKEDTNDESDPA